MAIVKKYTALVYEIVKTEKRKNGNKPVKITVEVMLRTKKICSVRAKLIIITREQMFSFTSFPMTSLIYSCEEQDVARFSLSRKICQVAKRARVRGF